MAFKTITNQETHTNGRVSYVETIAVLPHEKEHLYSGRRQHPDGYSWIRIGKQAKYFDNGQLAWLLNYDSNGNVLKENNPSYRRDGSIIQY